MNSIHLISEPEIQLEILDIEYRNSPNPQKLNISLIYCAQGQVNPLQMLENRYSSEAFKGFLRRMGVPVKSYKLMVNHQSSWRGLKVSWYLATHLNDQEQRQFIGNSMVAIYFTDAGNQFEPSQIQLMGSIGVIHLVVSPDNNEDTETTYRVGAIYKETLGVIEPVLPHTISLDGISLRDFLLTKAFNGCVAAMSHPPLDRMFQFPRGEAINAIAKKYLPKNFVKKHV